MIISNKTLGLIVIILLIVIVFLNYDSTDTLVGPGTRGLSRSTYLKKCIDLYKKERNPDPKLIKRPPVREIPADMYDEFTMYGKMPNRKYWYINEVYSDSTSNNKTIMQEYSIMDIAKLVEKVKNNEPQPHYGDKVLNELMGNYSSYVKDKSVVVIGTQLPWVEAIAYYHGATYITTLDYTRKKYRVANMNWYHVNDFLDEHIEKRKIEEFDVDLLKKI
ncbi:unnamed protein product [Brachionus calyciflorus]|uniref:Uncharacterized protein n=1 Tax=Brachionus calyciflorus TaxID=104777 RepID=A0A814C4I4_9BILA|nr:unnamed protein product [Brachionus calyciflorus]